MYLLYRNWFLKKMGEGWHDLNDITGTGKPNLVFRIYALFHPEIYKTPYVTRYKPLPRYALSWRRVTKNEESRS